jgi:cytochrome c5
MEEDMKRVTIVAVAVAALIMNGPLAAAEGKAVYDKLCAICHKMLNPKMGDQAAWAPLIAQGADALTASVMKGKGMMLPRGGAASEEEVRAAVEYIIRQNK